MSGKDPNEVWQENNSSRAGEAICEECGSDRFRLGVNRSESVKITCAECDSTAAYCWSNDDGNVIDGLVPRTIEAETDQ